MTGVVGLILNGFCDEDAQCVEQVIIGNLAGFLVAAVDVVHSSQSLDDSL
jgi:hypothetical protein